MVMMAKIYAWRSFVQVKSEALLWPVVLPQSQVDNGFDWDSDHWLSFGVESKFWFRDWCAYEM